MHLSETEWRVMQVVWKRHPASVRDVYEALETETHWAYSTVKTILSRLTEKGVLSSSKRANASLFTPLLSRREAKGFALRRLLDRAFDGTFGSLVHHLVDEKSLRPAEKEEIRRLLAEDKGKGES
jgi:BlaI family penicillinase repressor